MKRITVVLKKVGQPSETLEVDLTLKSLQRLVGGAIEIVPIVGPIVAVVNEDGKLRELPANGCGIVGDFFIAKMGRDDFVALTAEEATKAKGFIESNRDIPPTWLTGCVVMSIGSIEHREYQARMAQHSAANKALWDLL